MLKKIGLGLVAIIVVFVLLGINLVAGLGGFNNPESRFAGTCEKMAGLIGPEDLAIDRQRGHIYVSAHDRRNGDVRGGVYRLDQTSGLLESRFDVTGGVPEAFFPHGISLYIKEDGTRRLFAISHPANESGDIESRVEVFDEAGEGFAHVKTIIDPLIRRPNDLVVTGPDSFYVTNDGGSERGSNAETIETLFKQRKTDVIYFDGEKALIAADKVSFANGINKLGDRVFVAQSVRFMVSEFQIEADNTLKHIKNHKMDGGPDNIEIAQDGQLLIGAHPNFFQFTGHASDAENLSSGRVIKLNPETGEQEEIFVTDGTEVSGLSVANELDGTLYIGSVFEPFLLKCEKAQTS